MQDVATLDFLQEETKRKAYLHVVQHQHGGKPKHLRTRRNNLKSVVGERGWDLGSENNLGQKSHGGL